MEDAMAFWEELVEGEMLAGPWSSALVGIGAVLTVPTMLPAIGHAMRPVMKAAVNTGLMAYGTARETVAEVGEQINDLIAEVREELEDGKHVSPPSSSSIITPAHEAPGGMHGETHEADPLIVKPGEEKKPRGEARRT
jgi:hypothetical protein